MYDSLNQIIFSIFGIQTYQMKLLLLIITLTLLLPACIDIDTGEHVTGNGNRTTEDRRVKNAEKVKVTGDMEVILAAGPTSVKIEADENVLPYITTAMNDDWLEIRLKDHMNIHEGHIKVYVTSPQFSHIAVTGSGNVSAEQKMESDEPLRFDVTGSGNIIMAIHSPRVNAGITGSGNINLSGETKDVDVSVTGSGNFNGLDLRAENVKVDIAGSGDVSVHANANLNADIHGSGNVKYRGSAAVHKNIGGSGAVDKVE